MSPTIRRFAKSKNRPIGRLVAGGGQEAIGSSRSPATIKRYFAGEVVPRSMSAADDYNRIWDMFAQTHRQTHGDNHVPVRDFNCCGEYAVMMAIRAASTLKPDYPPHLLRQMAAMPELDRDFYVKNILSTDGEPEPTDPEPLREYPAARISDLEGALKAAEERIAELQGELRKARVPEEAASGKA